MFWLGMNIFLKIQNMKTFHWMMAIAVLVLLSLASCRPDGQGNPNSVTVSGIGTVQARPDMAEMDVSFAHTAQTTREAKAAVEQKMRQVMDVLQSEKIESKDIRTLTLNYEVEYEYRGGRRIRIGQRAEQTLVVTVHDLIETPERLSSLLDKLVALDRVEVQNIRFDIEQKADLFKQSRELAYGKARDKAMQYAELCGRKLGKVLTLSESMGEDVARGQSLMSNIAAESKAYFAAGEALVPTGEQGVTSRVEVVFSLE